MIKYSSHNHIDPSLYTKYKIRRQGIETKNKTQVINENTIGERLESIKRKYASKEKNIFTLRSDSSHKERSQHLLRQVPYEKVRSNLNISMSNHKMQRTNISSKDFHERHERSKQKVCERVQNIQKINDKIKNILSRFDMNNSNKTNILKRNNLIQELALKPKKVQLMQQQFQSRDVKSSLSKLHQHRSSLRKLDAAVIHVSQNQSLNMTIDESFVIQKYNPSQAKPKSNQLLDLVSKICAQITHDEELRTAKYLFLLNIKQDKYEKLQKQFEKRGIFYSLEQLTQQMRFVQEQYDPFMFQTAHEDYGKYADTLLSANKHWKQNIESKFCYRKLLNDGIKQALISDNNNQEFTVSDFARFVNITSGNLYKNRDLIVILKRVSTSGLTYEKLFSAVCCDYQ